MRRMKTCRSASKLVVQPGLLMFGSRKRSTSCRVSCLCDFVRSFSPVSSTKTVDRQLCSLLVRHYARLPLARLNVLYRQLLFQQFLRLIRGFDIKYVTFRTLLDECAVQCFFDHAGNSLGVTFLDSDMSIFNVTVAVYRL
jgi:hypothetical protein